MSKYVGFRVGNVHESHVFSEYYCGGCGYPVTDHDSFCPECGGAFRECDASDLEVENAKLRKLIGAYHEYCLCNQYSKKSAHQLITEIEDMICELGIEVDG